MFMKVIYLEPGKGKTTALIDWLIEDFHSRIIVVTSNREKTYIAKKIATENPYPLDVVLNRIETFDSFLRVGFAGKLFKEIAVDNVDMFLQHYFHLPISLVTITRDEL